MPRTPRKQAAQPKPSNGLIDALKFVGLCTSDEGQPFETHVFIGSGWAAAFNSVLAAGQKITEDIYAAPHNTTIINALSKCGENISMTQLDGNRLSIKSDKFRVIVPGLDPSILHLVGPDPVIVGIDDRFREAMEVVSVLNTESEYNIYSASVLLNGGSVVASWQGKVLFEYWHGLDLPPNLAIPKSFVNAIIKTKKKLVGFGFSISSITVHFDDESWLRTQLYADKWPDVSRVFNKRSNPYPVPVGFYEAVAAVAPFSDEGWLYFDAGILRSHPTDAQGASYEVHGLPKGPIFNAKQLMLIKSLAEQVDFLAEGNLLMFFGKNIRGAIAGRTG